MKTVEQARETLERIGADLWDGEFSAAGNLAQEVEALIDAKIAAAAQAEKDRRHAFLASVRAGTVDAFLPMETEGNPVYDETAATPEDTAKGGGRDEEDRNIAHVVREYAATLAAKDQRIAELERQVDGLVKAAKRILPYLDWTIGEESPAHHPTMPSAVAAFKASLRALSPVQEEAGT